MAEKENSELQRLEKQLQHWGVSLENLNEEGLAEFKSVYKLLTKGREMEKDLEAAVSQNALKVFHRHVEENTKAGKECKLPYRWPNMFASTEKAGQTSTSIAQATVAAPALSVLTTTGQTQDLIREVIARKAFYAGGQPEVESFLEHCEAQMEEEGFLSPTLLSPTQKEMLLGMCQHAFEQKAGSVLKNAGQEKAASEKLAEQQRKDEEFLTLMTGFSVANQVRIPMAFFNFLGPAKLKWGIAGTEALITSSNEPVTDKLRSQAIGRSVSATVGAAIGSTEKGVAIGKAAGSIAKVVNIIGDGERDLLHYLPKEFLPVRIDRRDFQPFPLLPASLPSLAMPGVSEELLPRMPAGIYASSNGQLPPR